MAYDYLAKKELKSITPHKSEIELIALNIEATYLATCSKKVKFFNHFIIIIY